MNISEKIEYWMDIADYDMETSRSMQKSGRYLYTVFMCQQAIEKVLKRFISRRLTKKLLFPITWSTFRVCLD
jgi:HEPN domain-containing protein